MEQNRLTPRETSSVQVLASRLVNAHSHLNNTLSGALSSCCSATTGTRLKSNELLGVFHLCVVAENEFLIMFNAYVVFRSDRMRKHRNTLSELQSRGDAAGQRRLLHHPSLSVSVRQASYRVQSFMYIPLQQKAVREGCIAGLVLYLMFLAQKYRQHVSGMPMATTPGTPLGRNVLSGIISRGARFQTAAISDHFLILLELLSGLNKSLVTRETGSFETIDLGDSLIQGFTLRWAEMTALYPMIYTRGGKHDIRFDDVAH